MRPHSKLWCLNKVYVKILKLSSEARQIINSSDDFLYWVKMRKP